MATSSLNPSGAILGLRPGDIIDGRFEIVGLIGYGGQGVVLKVKHLEWDRNLALKLPLPEALDSASNQERFLQEAETWIRLGVHPNIVRCWFVHKISGLPGLFLDLIEGGSLEDKIQKKKILPAQLDDIVLTALQIAEGLTRAHSMGVVHRDIKPENILIRKTGQVCLTDFGLVKSIQSTQRDDPDQGPQAGSPSVTGTGQFLGSPRYGAPEQWNKSMTIGPTTDIYALGVLLYELLCGRRPFDAPGEEASVLELIHRHLVSTPPDPREFYPAIHEDFVTLVLSCLAKNPHDRPQSALILIETLTQLHRKHNKTDYRRPAPVPGGDRADLLNNAAVSLYSLGKTSKCRELLQQGLLLQSGHPECVYNLVQLNRREGKTSAVESLRRLRRADAKYQLALLCIEEGMGAQAIDLLSSIPEDEKNGLLHRVEGDALMYAKKFQAAEKAYIKAQKTMPNDQPTRLRKLLANQGVRGMEGHLFFPSLVSCYRNRAPDPELKLLLTHDSQQLVGVNKEEIVTFDIESQTPTNIKVRDPKASSVKKVWLTKKRLLLEDQTSFEMWDLTTLELLQRTPGRVLAASKDLKRLVLLKQDGVMLLDKFSNTAAQLQFPVGTRPSAHVFACFTSDESGLCIITPNGQAAQVDSEYNVRPLPWPNAIANFEKINCLQLSTGGLLLIGTKTGQLSGLQLTQQREVFTHQLPFIPDSIMLDSSEQVIVVSSPTHFGIFTIDGELLHRGTGACALDRSRTFVIAWSDQCLELSMLSPFRRVRSWAETIAAPVAIHIGADGRKAVSLGMDGEHAVWEVDENNRVYERNLLLTPGESYEQLISSFDSYLTHFQLALTDFKKGRFFLSYQSLYKARQVPGFLQAPEALELQWELSKFLRRDKLEAIWERLFLSDVIATSLSPDNGWLLIASYHDWTLLEFAGSSTTTRCSGTTSSPILACHLKISSERESLIVILDQIGTLTCLSADSGKLVSSQPTGIGPLKLATFTSDRLVLLSQDDLVANFDLKSMSVTATAPCPVNHVVQLEPLSRDRAVILTEEKPLIVDFKKKAIISDLPLSLEKLPGQVTSVSESPNGQLLLSGFSDGTLAISEQRSGKVPFAVNPAGEPITHSTVDLSKALGVAVSSNGRITLFCLDTGNVFQSFSAHSGYIRKVHLSENGRYITTRSSNGQFRLWELSWILNQQSGNVPIAWWPTGALGKIGKLFKRG